MIKNFIQKIFSSQKVQSDKVQTGVSANAPKVITVEEHHINPELVPDNALRVTHTLNEAGFKAFIVGGAVRDLLLGVKPKDFDVATDAEPEEIKKLFKRAFIIGRRFQIVHVVFGRDIIEVTTFRGETDDDAPTDRYGRILRDNNFGEQYEDAARRDFTINAMYYEPVTQTVLDYHNGMEDLRKKTLRIIGEPYSRYREDPVRMLRVARLAAKLNFQIEPATREPIPELAYLINNVPSARVVDEILKMLLSGYAMASLRELQRDGLHSGLLPFLEKTLSDSKDEKFLSLVLSRTDSRVKDGLPVSPGFLLAAMLWRDVLLHWNEYRSNGEHIIPALQQAADDVLKIQNQKLAFQRRFAIDMRELWVLQARFERRTARSAYKLIAHPRFRAAYDFLMLRCESGEIDKEFGGWWTDFVNADNAEREELLANVYKTEGVPLKKRSRRRKRKNNSVSE